MCPSGGARVAESAGVVRNHESDRGADAPAPFRRDLLRGRAPGPPLGQHGRQSAVAVERRQRPVASVQQYRLSNYRGM